MGNSWLAQVSPTINTSIVTGSSSFDLLNTTATTVNACGAATTLNLGYTGTNDVTVNFMAGLTASGKTKAISIGTAGASGSTTNISIGSSTSGSVTNLSLNGLINGGLSTPPNISSLNGTWVGWNSGGLGETIFANFRQAGSGGFDFKIYALNASLVSTPLQIKASSVDVTVAALNFTNATSAAVSFGVGGAAAPTFTTRSAGTKAVYYQTLSGSSVDYGRGIASATLWDSIPQANSGYNYKLYAGTTEILQVRGDGLMSLSGSMQATGSILSSSSTLGIGYATGAGGAVTQTTSKDTNVTINKVCGTITMNNAALAAGAKVSFYVFNSVVAWNDTVEVIARDGFFGNYIARAYQLSPGAFAIQVENTSGSSQSEAATINFSVIKGVGS